MFCGQWGGDVRSGSQRKGWRRVGDGGLNKVAADPTGGSIAPAVTAVNRHGI